MILKQKELRSNVQVFFLNFLHFFLLYLLRQENHLVPPTFQTLNRAQSMGTVIFSEHVSVCCGRQDNSQD